MNGVIANLINLDHTLFFLVNQQWTSPVMDKVMPFITDFNKTWPFLTGMVALLLLLYKLNGIRIVVACAVAVLIADATAARVIKPLVDRQRPEFSMPHTRLLVPSQGSPSFPSNHAANAIAVAMVIAFSVPTIQLFTWILALAIGYSRIYVGVHYPTDVLGGIILGFLAGVIAIEVLWHLGLQQSEDPVIKTHWKKSKFYKNRKRKA